MEEKVSLLVLPKITRIQHNAILTDRQHWSVNNESVYIRPNITDTVINPIQVSVLAFTYQNKVKTQKSWSAFKFQAETKNDRTELLAYYSDLQ
jgi:hypothetical protein